MSNEAAVEDDPYHVLRANTKALHDLLRYGCSDGHCRMRPRTGGMHTNGGCRCIDTLADMALDVAAEADRFRRGKPRPALRGYLLP